MRGHGRRARKRHRHGGAELNALGDEGRCRQRKERVVRILGGDDGVEARTLGDARHFLRFQQVAVGNLRNDAHALGLPRGRTLLPLIQHDCAEESSVQPARPP